MGSNLARGRSAGHRCGHNILSADGVSVKDDIRAVKGAQGELYRVGAGNGHDPGCSAFDKEAGVGIKVTVGAESEVPAVSGVAQGTHRSTRRAATGSDRRPEPPVRPDCLLQPDGPDHAAWFHAALQASRQRLHGLRTAARRERPNVYRGHSAGFAPRASAVPNISATGCAPQQTPCVGATQQRRDYQPAMTRARSTPGHRGLRFRVSPLTACGSSDPGLILTSEAVRGRSVQDPVDLRRRPPGARHEHA